MSDGPADLSDLYGELVLDHARSPHNRHAMECPPARTAQGFNPLCGDQVTVYVRTNDDHIDDASFTGEGCAYCLASASMLTDAVKGKGIDEARALLAAYRKALTERGVDEASLGRLAALLSVRRQPMRVKCATLAAHTLRAALDDVGVEPVTTE